MAGKGKGKGNAWQMADEIPASIKAAFDHTSVTTDGSVDLSWLTALFQDVDGQSWTEERVAQAIAAAGGTDGRIKLDNLLTWIFSTGSLGASAPTAPAEESAKTSEAQQPPPSSEPAAVEEAEPLSPKIGRKKRGSSANDWSSPGYSTNPGTSTEAPDGDLAAAMVDPDVDPTSPTGHRRRATKKRACDYETVEGERMFVPRSYQEGTLVLKADKTFDYIHSGLAKFAEGVQGQWTSLEDDENKVTLIPTGFGWCYEESFDPEEVMGLRPTITLSTDDAGGNGRRFCDLPEELCKRFNWIDPSLPEE